MDITEPLDNTEETAELGTPAVVEHAEPEPTSGTTDRPTPRRSRKRAPEPAEQVAEPLRLAQFYVTPAIDKYLRTVRAEALTQDVDVTASAVARMALQRLVDETTPRELVRRLGEPKTGKRGRPRR